MQNGQIIELIGRQPCRRAAAQSGVLPQPQDVRRIGVPKRAVLDQGRGSNSSNRTRQIAKDGSQR